MKLLRLSLLSSYLNYLNKNQKKALMFINLGIFLCVFAVSTSLISFFTEKKISEKQTELLYLQIQDKEFSGLKSQFEIFINSYSTLLLVENNYKVEKEFLAQSKFESQLLSGEDFFKPYIHANMLELKTLLNDKEFTELLNPNGDDMKYILELLEISWNKDEIDIFKEALLTANKSLNEVYSINLEDYKLKKFQSLENIILEIINSDQNNVYNSDPKLVSDYLIVKGLYFDFIYFLEEFFKIISGMKESGQEDIKKLNIEIISLSNKEKNYILGTFIFQFIIFIIIQFFEVSSINFNLVNLRGKNEKKIKR